MFYTVILLDILKSVEKPSKVVVISPLTSIMADQVSKLSQFNFPANAIQLSQQCHVVGKENGMSSVAHHKINIF